jgi:hypothetical protein
MNAAVPIDWFAATETAPPGGTGSWTSLPPPEQLLIWSMRHMLVCWPSCASVRAALHRAYGDEALGVEHLLRCLLTAVGAYSARRLRVGDPTCALLLADEAALLSILRLARQDPGAACERLVDLCAAPQAARLLPLAASLAQVADCG